MSKKKTLPSGFVGLAVLCCTVYAAASVASMGRAATVAQAAEVFITDVELARDDGVGRGGQVVRGFRVKDNPLHCLVTLSRPAPGTRVRFVWTAVDAGGERGKTIATAEGVTRPGEIVCDGQVRLPREWPAGRYRVAVTVNGKFSRVVDFAIE